MGGLIGWLAGAPQQASNAQSYYQNAANQMVNAYGSPAAQTFSREYMGAMQPQFQQLNQQTLDTEAATGLGGSGAGRAMMGDTTANEAASLAQGVAPMYQQALGQYGNIMEAMPGAQEQAYQGAISDFYNMLQSGAMAYGMSSGGGGSFNPAMAGAGITEGPQNMTESGGTYSSTGGYGQVGYGV